MLLIDGQTTIIIA